MSASSTIEPSSDKLIVHFLEKSRAESIIWLLEELKLNYEIKYYKRKAGVFAPKELSDIHPLGKSPILTHNNLVIAETGNIVAYLLRLAPNAFSPTDLSPEQDQRNSYYLHYSQESLMPILTNKIAFSMFPKAASWYARPIISNFTAQVDASCLEKELVKHLRMIDSDLQKTSSIWFCGGEEPTAADFAMYFPLRQLSDGGATTLTCPDSIKAWVAKAEETPALKAANAKLRQLEKAHATAPRQSANL